MLGQEVAGVSHAGYTGADGLRYALGVESPFDDESTRCRRSSIWSLGARCKAGRLGFQVAGHRIQKSIGNSVVPSWFDGKTCQRIIEHIIRWNNVETNHIIPSNLMST